MVRFAVQDPNGLAVQQLEGLIRTAIFKPANALVGLLLQQATDQIDAVSGLAVLFVLLGRTRHLWLSGLLAFTGAVIGGMGFSSWTPCGFFPEVVYTRSSDTFEFPIRSGWLFIAPLVLGGVAALLALRKQRRSRCAA